MSSYSITICARISCHIYQVAILLENLFMLPDLPAFKSDVLSILLSYFGRQVHQNLGVFQQAGKRTAHEGNRMRINRGDGTVEDSSYNNASSEVALKFDEIPYLTLQERLRVIDKMAMDMAHQMSAHMFRTLDQTLEKAGQIVDNAGKPFDAESILKVLNTIHVDFNPDGTHSPLTFVTAPGSHEIVEKALELLQSDPELRLRYEEMIQKKRMEWRDREASRKLVG